MASKEAEERDACAFLDMTVQTETIRPRRVCLSKLAGLGAVLVALVVSGCVPVPLGEVGVSVGPVGDRWAVEWDPQLGTPTRMTNGAIDAATDVSADTTGTSATYPRRGTPALDPTAAEAAVRAVFRENAQWFRLRPREDDFAMVYTQAQSWLRVLRFAQLFRGVKVAGAGYEAHVLPNGRVGTLEGHFHPDLSLDVTPGIASAQADAAARTAITSFEQRALTPFSFERDSGFEDREVLTVIPSGGFYRLAWGVVIEVAPREAYRVYVDANDATVLGRERVWKSWMR